MYARINKRVFFLIPTIAVGIDEFDYLFVEIAWLNVAIGFGKVD